MQTLHSQAPPPHLRLSALRHLLSAFLSSPLSSPLTLISAEVYSGSLTFPASPPTSPLFPPSFYSSSRLTVLYTYSLSVSQSQLCTGYFAALLWTCTSVGGPSVERHGFRLCCFIRLISCLSMKSFPPLNTVVEPLPVVPFVFVSFMMLLWVQQTLRLHYEISKMHRLQATICEKERCKSNQRTCCTFQLKNEG